ncbi:myozenin-3 [Spea bombifrons]|uniref:myozenin-3 n=1 Tax=Spea bombifrons TaxID=233779 RepID=UPI00234A7B4A|nr:myozenin-3 [Spea bombifrons]
MFPIQSDIVREHKRQAYAIAREMTGDSVPHLDLGKKVSLPQDLMMEELSLQRNRGSCMFLERQKRVQRFILEHQSNQTNAGSNVSASQSGQTAPGEMSGKGGLDGKENDHSEIYITPGGSKTPPIVPKKSPKVLQLKMSLNPGAIAPGYSGPLKEVPYEKFNSTAIPRSYRSPWIEDKNTEYITFVNEVPPEPTGIALDATYRSYNRTPVPFGSLSVVDGSMTPNIFEELQAHIEETETNGLELMSQRPSFNRTPRGWAMKYIPESVDL